MAAGALAAPPPLLVVGDSLSAAHNIPVEAGWVSLLEDRLQSEMETPPEVINASISGETSAGGLARLPRLLREHAPGVVIIELGGNDALRGLPPAQLRGNLERMVELSREAGARVLLLGIDIPPNYGGAYRERVRGVYTGLAEALDVPLMPFFLEGVALEPGLMQSDGIHPTADAQPRLLENVWPVLRPLLED
ncbi:arylesterase [Coralloluteibacterium thermophilus]|uniref:Arylesterase n=1 Tax=Coralloluteibacterium thermophilum TaxID=2707049 RepID=A0ABV9NP90_9GAMM